MDTDRSTINWAKMYSLTTGSAAAAGSVVFLATPKMIIAAAGCLKKGYFYQQLINALYITS
jgi:hypothetical protein